MRTVSFDVFDTLVTRIFARPADLFVALGEDLVRERLVAIPAAEFGSMRVRVEREARRGVPAGEVNLGEIYERLAGELGWDAATRAKVERMESDLEERSLRAVPGMVERVAKAREGGARILFLSDMYLPPALLKRVLEREGFFASGDRLVVSGDVRCAKGTGKMFERVQGEHSLEPGQWLHVGDHPVADVEIPLRMGLQVERITATQLSRYERMVRGDQVAGPLWRSRLAGAMRLARLGQAAGGARNGTIWDVGSNVVGPLLFGFVHWCLAEASRLNLRRLYFVSRDGQILGRMAEAMAKAWDQAVEIRYLYGSRQAWHPAGVTVLERSDLEWVVAPTRGLTLRRVFARLALAPEVLEEPLARAGFPAEAWSSRLDEAGQARLGEWLLSEALRPVLAESGARLRGLALRYLEQEGLADGVPFGMVDIGWFGNLQRSLSRLLTQGGHSTEGLTGLYYGLLGRKPLPPGQRQLAYVNQTPEGMSFLRGINLAMFEIFTAADHGTVVGYEEHAGGVRARLAEPRNGPALAWGLADLHASVLEFTRIWATSVNAAVGPTAEYDALGRALYQEWYHRPTREEARVWGDFPFSDEQGEAGGDGLVPKWGTLRTWQALVSQEKRSLYWWHEGSLAIRSCLPLRLFLALRRLKRRSQHG